MNIVFLEGYNSGSHRYFHQILKKLLSELDDSINFKVISLKGRHWRWRLLGSHFHLARELNRLVANKTIELPDYIIATSLTDTASLRGLLLPELRSIPLIQYMHENQMSYPLSERRPNPIHDHNVKTHLLPTFHLNQLLGADHVFFNSHFHFKDFFKGLDDFCQSRPDYRPLESLNENRNKCRVVHIPVLFPKYKLTPFHKRPKRLLWNHRWEYDKNPSDFIELSRALLNCNGGLEFSFLGGNNLQAPKEFTAFKNDHPANIVNFGFVEQVEDYFFHLSQCRLLPVTSYHDFLGLSVLEAMAWGVIPLLPRRLVYPELIPPELHTDLLYDTLEELRRKSLLLLENGLTLDQKCLLDNHIKKFSLEAVKQSWADFLSIPM